MPPPRQGDRKKQPSKPNPKQSRSQPKQSDRKPNRQSKPRDSDESSEIDFSSVHISLQQLLLDVFKTALLSPSGPSPTTPHQDGTDASERSSTESLDTKSLIQTIKSHLYQRDFDSAFADAGEDLLRAYALRWSAARALGYAGLFRGVLSWMQQSNMVGSGADNIKKATLHGSARAVCIGGGAGAEIVALAAAWRDLYIDSGATGLEKDISDISLGEQKGKDNEPSQAHNNEKSPASSGRSHTPQLSVAAVDIADWSSVVERLSQAIISEDVPVVPSLKHKPPLIQSSTQLNVAFRRVDVLSLPPDELKEVILGKQRADHPESILVTLMFTLNELFSTSMAKSTGLLLHLTDIMPSGAVLLVVDSPGSYSTLKLGKGKDGASQERQYPMKFLLDHTLTSVAEKKWECIFTQDSRWWRRDASRLIYEVGEGAGLEDMRFQVHLYRRT